MFLSLRYVELGILLVIGHHTKEEIDLARFFALGPL